MSPVSLILPHRVFLLALFLLLGSFWSAADALEIRIKCEPGVHIFIAGKYAGFTSRRDGGLILPRAIYGTHNLKALKPGYARKSLTFTLDEYSSPGHVVEIEGPWEKPAAGPEEDFGDFSEPASEEGYSNDRKRHRTGRAPPASMSPSEKGKLIFFNVFPLLCRPLEDGGTTGGLGVDLGFRLTKWMSLHVLSAFSTGSSDGKNCRWTAINVGPRIKFGKFNFEWFFRPALGLSSAGGYWDLDYYYTSTYSSWSSVDYSSNKFAISITTGPEFRVSSHVSLGGLFGVELPFGGHEGEETETTYKKTWPYTTTRYYYDQKSHYVIFGAAYIRFSW